MNNQLNLQKANATARGSNPIIVKFNDSKREYEVDNNGEVAERPSSDIEMSNIFEYKIENNEVTILGVKDEYLEPYEAGSLNNNRKIASIHNFYIADIEEPVLTKLVKEVGTALEIPDTIEEKTVVKIGYLAFAGIVNLESIIIPDTVRTMQNAIFYNCYNLRNVKLSNNTILLGEKVFGNCTKLTTISLPNSVKRIEYEAFYGCTGITSIKIPIGVEYIGNGAFGLWEENQTINCEATEKPSEWSSGWDSYRYPYVSASRKAQLNWGVTQ